MFVYLVRHAEAVDGGIDFERELTNGGRARCQKVAKALKILKCKPEVIVSSPLRRAEQTATFISETLKPANGLEQSGLLAGGADADGAARWVCSWKVDEIMLVGHMPDMSILASQLLCGDDDAAFDFKKLGVCCIAFTGKAEPGCGRLMWFMKPSQLELVAE